MSLQKTLVVAALLCAGTTVALAAPVKYLIVDRSSEAVMTKDGSDAVWADKLPQKLAVRLAKLYPTGRYGFISQVEGGFTESKQCVVTARVMLVPRSGKSLVFDAKKGATTFDAQPGLTQPQCQDLAKAKLGEAIAAVMSSLVAEK